jgi:uroporphyrinogen-III synthase
MAAEPAVLVTRPEGQGAELMAGLRAIGCRPVHLPLLAIEAIDPLPGATRQRVLDLDRYDHVLFISANAARIGLARIEDLWPQLPVQQRYWAVGESTASVLEAAGLRVERPATDMSSEGLLAMPGLQDLTGQRCLIVRGEGGREHLANSLEERGAQVDALVCYRRRALAYDPAALDRRLGGESLDLVLISSGEGVEALSGLLRDREHTNLARATLLAPSQRVAALARDHGWQRVQTVANASDRAMLAAVQQWCEARLGETQL